MAKHSINYQWYAFLVKNLQLGHVMESFTPSQNAPMNLSTPRALLSKFIAFKHTPHFHILATNPPPPLKYPIS